MYTSSLRSFKYLSASALFLFASCNGSRPEGWHKAQGIEAGGFSVLMPVANAVQQGDLVLNGDSVRSYLALASDSGVTYTAAYLDLPASLVDAAPEEQASAIWSMLNGRLGVLPLDEPPPIGPPTPTTQSAWYLAKDGTRLAAVVHLRRGRAVLLNSACPDRFFGEPERARMMRYFSSIEFAP